MTAITLSEFKNPIPSILKVTGKVLLGALMAIVAFGESAGRARAASQLAEQGYYKEAQALMLKEHG